MNVLITGAGGQLGRALVQTSPTHANVSAYAHAKLDVSDLRALRSCIMRHRPDVIVNAAAYTVVDQAESDPLLAQRINADARRYLAEVARTIHARLIHISTNFVFDGAAGVPYTPYAATNPMSVYGATKRAGEIAVVETLPGSSVVLRTAVAIAEEGATLGLLSADVAVNPTTTDEYVTPAPRPHYGVLDATSLQGIASSVHWRKCLRLVLEEIKSA